MMKKWKVILLLAAAYLLAMTSCATTTMNTVWKDKDYTGGKLEEVLVIGVAKNPAIRRSFEDQFVAQLKARGITAFASYAIIPSEAKLDKETVNVKVKDLEVGAVLVTRLVDTRKEKVVVPTQHYYTDWYNYYARTYEVVRSPAYYTEYEYEVVSLETNLYDTKSGKLIYSGLSDTSIEDTVEAAIKSFIKVLIESLAKNELV